MTYITQLTGRKTTSILQIIAMALIGVAMLVLQSTSVQAQWTTPDGQGNINNTNSGKVGVGAAPTAPLTLTTPGNTLDGTYYSSFTVRKTGDTFSGIRFDKNSTALFRMGTDTNNNFQISRFVGAGAPDDGAFYLNQSGFVGIGTTTPGEFVHVRRDQNAPTHLMVENTTAGALAYADLKVKNNLGHFAQFGLYSSTTTTYGALAAGNAFAYTTSPAMVIMADNGTGIIKFATGGLSERMRIDASGNLGIGTTTPGEFVHVRKDQNAATHLVVENTTAGASSQADFQVKNNLGHSAQFGLYSSTTTTVGALAADNAFTYTTSPAMVIMANNVTGIIKFATGGNSERMRIDASGSVGIGTTTPSATLHVQGTGRITGNLTVDGNIAAKYQDVAEWVQSSQQLSAGTVVVLDHTKSNQVVVSSQAYDTRVAGVISLQPGIVLGENGIGKVLVATTGRVRVKVDATHSPIEIGDLLVTGDQAGFAMKSEPLMIGKRPMHSPGTLIGKALEPLLEGRGEILVLLSLQ